MTDPQLPSTMLPKHGDSHVSARRLKKREIDRRCQRQARERTKSRIAYLESLVENLRQADSDERSAALMKRLVDTEKERDALAQTLKDIHKALTGHEPEIKTEPGSDDSSHRDNDQDTTVDGLASPEPTTNTTAAYRSLRQESAANSYDSMVNVHVDPREIVQATADVTDLPKVCNDACECCKEARDSQNGAPKSLWRFANNTLVEPYTGPSPITTEEDLLAEDMPIRIVLEGWDAVEQQFGLPLSWRILRQIDQSLFARCAPVERLAIFRMMHLLLQYHRDATPERRAKLPPWFLARPSQTVPHAYAINYFVWPGLRERFIFQQHKYCSNQFWLLFADSLEMSWPYDLRDCFAQRWDTGIYQLTPLFQECIGDISRWTMRPDMFMQFPDLRCDIPVSTLSPRPVSNIVQYQLAQFKSAGAMASNMAQDSKRSRNDELARQQLIVGSWGSGPPWADSNAFFMASQPQQYPMATPWIG